MAAGDIGWCILIIEHIINHGSPGASSLLCSFGRGFGWGKMYSGSITLIKYYSAIYLAIGGWDGMDCTGGHWMTCSIYKTPCQLRRLAVPPRCWGHWEPFIMYIWVPTVNLYLFHFLLCIRRGRNGWMGCYQFVWHPTYFILGYFITNFWAKKNTLLNILRPQMYSVGTRS